MSKTDMRRGQGRTVATRRASAPSDPDKTKRQSLPEQGANPTRILGSFAWLTGGRIVAALLQALVLVVVARVAGPSYFGVLSAFMGVAIICQVGFDLGFSTYITRLRASTPHAPEVTWSIQIYRFLGIFLLVTLVLIAAAGGAHVGNQWWVLIPVAVASAVERQADIRVAIAIADGDVWKNTVIIVTRRLLTLIFLLLALQFLRDPILGYGIAALVATCASLVASHTLIRFVKTEARMQLTDVRGILRVSKNFWVNSIGTQLRNLDVLLVAAVGSPVMAGYYSAISRTTNPLLMFSSSLSAVLLPVVSRLGNSSLKILIKPLTYVLVPMLAGYGILAFFAEQVVLIAFGENYEQAVDGFRVVVLALAFAGTNSLQSTVLQARGREAAVGFISIISSVIGLIAVSVGVISWGITGAAAGLAISYFFQFVLLFCAMCGMVASNRRSAKSI